MSLAENVAAVRARIVAAARRSGRCHGEISVIAVSKTFPAEIVRAAYVVGLRQFAESRVQEAEAKLPQLADLGASWHLIGHLQSNKVRKAVRLFDRIDSVDSPVLAQKLNEIAEQESKPMPILIEVHSGEMTKSGVAQGDLLALAEKCARLEHLKLQGLMTVPPHAEDPQKARSFFRNLRLLRDKTAEQIAQPLPVLSMGMSHDFEIAIEEGATEVRIGTALFGQRPRPD